MISNIINQIFIKYNMSKHIRSRLIEHNHIGHYERKKIKNNKKLKKLKLSNRKVKIKVPAINKLKHKLLN